MSTRADLTEFLRTRRARMRPEDVGLPPFGGRRRVPGLRREELAQLAGVSVDYYVRLEQGRTNNVSREVLDAVARALRLDPTEREHLHRLAHPQRTPVRPQQVRPAVQHLLDALDRVPAFVLGRNMTVLAWNEPARLVVADFAVLPAKERNMARQAFLAPQARELYVDWPQVARETVAYLRMSSGQRPDDAELAELVADLSAGSEEFRRLWASHDVKDKAHGTKRLRHPLVGEFTVEYETLPLPGDPDQVIVTYTAPPGSAAAEALHRLAEIRSIRQANA
ncbi:helix-turn-helix transcriptional regulator [Labedaea rhizosphaerae]|uniref:Transcriptional regulator with XRE-family HTH domain n=1 Tax=Labedaea rhizosphaerae TaxID=598644 RepID=A0A4R6RXX1_LABRH|nr:helix-turn-helix transcriptional regulator [Labedaea rhizosphaerae]TDP91853.1 transcriptional regulator with XRE-family HTH domain [Labedaea rhizosphaerae]